VVDFILGQVKVDSKDVSIAELTNAAEQEAPKNSKKGAKK
jgi:hypothetical protein